MTEWQSPGRPGRDGWAGYDGGKHRQGMHILAPADTLDYLLALRVAPASAQVMRSTPAVQEVTGHAVSVAVVEATAKRRVAGRANASRPPVARCGRARE